MASTALPRSTSTTTPAPLSAAEMAAMIAAASVPSEPSGIPPAASMRRSSPAIWRASSTVPAAICAEWLTMTIPTSASMAVNPTRR